MSTISAGTSSGTALVSTGDTSGNLELQSSGVTKLTVGSSGVTLASALPVASGGTGATSLTANNVLLGNGTSQVQLVAPGSNGNILTSNGTTWASTAPAGAGWSLISTTTISGSATTLDISSGFSSTYDDYVILIDGLTYNTGNAFDIRTAYGGSFLTASYIQQYTTFSSGTSAQIGAGQDRIYLTSMSSTYPSFLSGMVWIMNRNSANYRSSIVFNVYQLDGSSPYSNLITVIGSGGNTAAAAALSGIRFFATTTNSMQTGTFRLYGVQK